MSFELNHVVTRFGSFLALDDVSLQVRPGEMLALLGPSGCGKTTLLRVMAGLETPESGRVVYDGVDVTNHAPSERKVGFVFQHYALFKHMTVFENVAFGLRVRGAAEGKIRARVTELLARVRMEQFVERAPSQLSGGQRQRVALARALAAEPKVLLLDEPFGALDARVRHELRVWLRTLHEESHLTTILVTHDRDDAFEVADRVVVMHAGRIEQIATPDELFQSPSSPWVMRFLGDVNEYPHHDADLAEGAARRIAYVRPHELDLSHSPLSEVSKAVQARVRRVSPLGSVVRVELDVEGAEGEPIAGSTDGSAPRPKGSLVAEIAEHRFRELEMRRGDLVFASPRSVRVFDAPQA